MSSRALDDEELMEILNESDEEMDDLDELQHSSEQEVMDTDEFELADPVTNDLDDLRPEIDPDELPDYLSDDGLENAEELPQIKFRKIQTCNRLVNSIDKALDESNYDPMPKPSETKVYTAKFGASLIKWTNASPISVGRQNSLNIIHGVPGVRDVAKHAMTESSAWSVLITDHMISDLVERTNIKILNLLSQVADQTKKKCSFIRPTDEVELKAFFGLLYARGLFSLNSYHVDHLFGDVVGHHVFGATMGKSRFKFLLRFLQFDDAESRSSRWKNDRFAAFREFFETFNINCAKALIPEDFLALDETLYPMRTQVGFRQFNPKKPAKYGLLFRSINSSRYAYTHYSMPYAGKPVGVPNNYYVTGTENAVKYLIGGLKSHVPLKGRNISIDRLYTSISLAKWMISEGITVVGTLKANRVGIPSEVKSLENRSEFSTETYWEEDDKNVVLSSYVVNTKSTGKRNVLMLSTMPPLLAYTKDDGKKKPAIYKLYDFTKGGTDIVDQRIGYYTCKTKSRKWTITALSYLLDTARVNASTIFSLNKKVDPRKMNSFDFGWNLVLQLTKPQIEARSDIGLQIPVRMKISIMLGKNSKSFSNPNLPVGDVIQSDEGTKKRCRSCISDVAGTGGYKKKMNSLGKTAQKCKNCHEAVCKRHANVFCPNCDSKI